MFSVQKELIESIRASVFAGNKPPLLKGGGPQSGGGIAKEVLSLAKKHSVLPTIMADYEEISKTDNQLFAADEMQSFFEQHGIYNCALKGINTKHRYPKPELRSMSDLDILYKSTQHKEFKAAMKALGYEFDSEGRKHDFYKRQPYIMVEAHRELFSPEFPKFYEYYKNPWDKLILKPGCQYTYEMKLEDEFIYCIVHAAEHMKLGGIGIRPILDVAVYLSSARGLRHRFSGGAGAQSASEGELESRRTEEFNWEYFYAELDKLGLRTFYNKISAIAEKWFLGGNNEVSADLEDFILEAGLYGTEENNNAARVGGSRVKFLTSSLFPSYESMCSVYPWLKGNKALLPIAWAERGTKAILHRRGNIKTQFNRLRKSTNSINKLNVFYAELDL